MGTIFNKGFHHKYIRPCPLIFQASQHLTLDIVGPRDETGHGWSSLGRMLSILTSLQWCLPFVLPLQHYIFQLILRWQGKSYNINHRIQQPHSLHSLFWLACHLGTWLMSPGLLWPIESPTRSPSGHSMASINGNLPFTKQDFPLQLWEGRT